MMQIFSKKRGEKGFTLIELLVVIAIIGILAGIVLVALGGARTRARDARMQAGMSQIRAAAELYYSINNNSYVGFSCATTTPDMVVLCGDINAQNGPAQVDLGAATFIVEAQRYCAEVQTNDAKFWCVDYKGTSKSFPADTQCAVGTFCCEGACPL